MKTAASGDLFFSDRPQINTTENPMSVPIAVKTDKMAKPVRVNLTLSDNGLSALIEHLHDVAEKRADYLERIAAYHRSLLSNKGAL